jgi:hypothetical protein
MIAPTVTVTKLANALLSNGESNGNTDFGIAFYLMVARTMLECDQINLDSNPLFKLLDEVTRNLVTAERLKMRL